jgi:hypothetical protein
MFKVGDKVQYKHGGTFCNGKKVVTVREIRENRVYGEENNAWSYEHELELHSKPFDELLQELAKEVALYEEKVNEFSKKVEKLHITMQVIEELNKK